MRATSSPSATKLVVIMLPLCFAVTVAAQTTKEQQRGFMPGGSYALGDIESISNSNGNVMLNIQLAQLPPGRGGMPGPALRLVYNSKLWDPEPVAMYGSPSCSANGCTYPYQGTTTFLKDNRHGGWGYAYDYHMEVVDRRSEGQFPRGGAPSRNANGGGLDYSGANLFKVRLRFPDGSLHEFHPTGRAGLEQTSGYYNASPDGNYYYCQNVSGSGSSPSYAVVSTGPSYGTPNTYYTTDGTYLKLVTYGTSNPTEGQVTRQYWTLYFPDGTRVTTVPAEAGDGWQRVYDRNGNFVQFGGNAVAGQPPALISDQLGRAIRKSEGASEDTVTASGFGGAELRWTVRWRTAALRGKTYYAGQLGVQPFNWSWRVVESITLPAQTGLGPYSFDYNDKDAGGGASGSSVGWGELSYVELPTGAKALYEYKMDAVDLASTGATQVLQNYPVSKDLKYLSEYDGGSTEVTDTWLYSFNFSAENSVSTGTSVTAPDGGVTSETFINNPGHYDHGLTKSMTLPDGTTTVRVWQQNRLGDDIAYRFAEMNPVVKTEYRTVPGSNNTSQTAIKDYTYDKNGNVLQVSEYDWAPYSGFPRDQFGFVQWGIPAGTVPKRVTRNTYHNPTPDSSVQSSNANSYDKATAPAVRNALASSEVSDGAGQVLSRSEFTYDNASTTANLTLRRSWDSTKGDLLTPQPGGIRLDAANSVSVSNEYDDNTTNAALRHGNVTLSVDANGNRTKYTYGPLASPDGTAYSGLYATLVVAAEGTGVQRTTSSVYDISTGLATKVTDEDNQVSTSTTHDALGRQTLVEDADDELDANGVSLERHTVTEYAGDLRRVVVRSDLNSTGDGKLISVQHYDQLGRVRLSRTLEDASAPDAMEETAGIKVQTRYMFSGQNSYRLVSNPYRAATSAAAGEATMGWSLIKSDQAGRAVRAETFEGAVLPAPFASGTANAKSTGAVVTAYDSNAVTVTDQAGRQRRSVSDALGRLVQVFEAPNATGYNYLTSYSYDANGNLTQVLQGEQTRTFSYSSLSRLTSAQNPENGTVRYKYDANGNLALKIDPRPRPGTATLPATCPVQYTGSQIATCYEYDALGRVKLRSYNDGTPNVTYEYDASGANSKGRLSSVSSSVSTYSYTAYDALGRVTGSSQTTGGVTYTMPEYVYNLAGGLTSEKYPSGKVVKTEYAAAGRLAGVQNQASGLYYAGAATGSANRIQYTAGGAPSVVKLGNGLWEHTDYNSRLQPTQVGLGASAADSSKIRLDYTYGEVVNGALEPKRNNGNLQSQRIYVEGALDVTQTYEYDGVNRLKTAEEKAGANSMWKQVYTYDRYGNRNFGTGTTYPNYAQSLTDPVGNPVIDTANNRIKTAASGQGNYIYDAAGNLTRTLITAQTYRDLSYDAENKQVRAGGGAAAGGADYYYDGDGRRVKKVSAAEQTIFVHDALGRMVAEYSTQIQYSGTRYLTQDHLGSTRVVTDAQKNAHSDGVAQGARRDYLPFGEALSIGRSGYSDDPSIKQTFTGKERDPETMLDYFGARYYANSQGRFTSPDPLLSSGRPSQPQSWNRYAYTLNNPLTYIDPTGMYEYAAGTTNDQKVKFEAALQRARNKLADIEKRYGKTSKEYTDAVRSLNAYGNPNQANGVTVQFGALAKGTQGTAVGTLSQTGQNTALVTVDLKQNDNGNELLATIAHEGSHVQDNLDYQNAFLKATEVSPGLAEMVYEACITHGATETRAYGVSSVFAEFTLGGGTGESPMSGGGGSYSIKFDAPPVKSVTVGGEAVWKSSWQTLDIQTIRTNRANAISDGLQKDPRYSSKLNQRIQP